MIQFRYIYFLCSFLLLSLVAGCGKRKPKVLTIPQKLVSQNNVSVGARACNWSDYSTFLGANRACYPFDSKLVQIYIKNNGQSRYKLSGKNIQRMSPEIFQSYFQAYRGASLKEYGSLTSKIAGCLLLNVPVSLVIGLGAAYGLTLILHMTHLGQYGCGCGIIGALIFFPAITIACYVGLSAYAIYKFSSNFRKQKMDMAIKPKKNLFTSNSCFDIEPQRETHKVFFVSNKDFKNLEKDGILLSLIDRQTKEKLVFSVPLS